MGKLKRTLDPDEAPEGYRAVEDTSKRGCVGCAFESSKKCGLDRACTGYERKDGCLVIFEKR